LCGSIYAQQLATVGKLFTKSEADKLYGSVIKSVSIGSTELYPAGIKSYCLWLITCHGFKHLLLTASGAGIGQ